ncbi:Trans-2,cis-3-Decenoyl-ACP isomerase [Streptococcus sp. DD10]|uniref:enoyl-CoA hydratase n=1 Tax=Streptococcus sp. DD10 TaxID=1777878 RepID=UPI000799D609|nr:enoyl-CoA hydratase [Streptococcus sp. DD10]KXT74533.1 Trans-2,cis-3-Decenoyl-ACP isomerase [Streptococcus sp. DD10]
MEFKNLLYFVEEGLATITLNRPEVANGFNIPLCEEILTALSFAEKDETVNFVLLNAKGSVFSVGGDLVEMKRAVDEDDIQSLVKIAELVNEISYTMKHLPKPVIMVVDGAVAGAAANMAIAADFCIASEKAKFIQAFVGVGLAPDAGGLYLLTRAIGINRATHLVMTGESLKAEKALEYGIVYKLCESEKLEKTTEQLLKKLKRSSSNSFRAIKEMIWKSQFAGWSEYAELELELQKSLAFTEDFKEGVLAHADRRRPNFTGK